MLCIQSAAQRRYRFQSIVPSGYGCAPDGPTQALLDRLGRHGQRPAHIKIFSAPAIAISLPRSTWQVTST